LNACMFFLAFVFNFGIIWLLALVFFHFFITCFGNLPFAYMSILQCTPHCTKDWRQRQGMFHTGGLLFDPT
jgi:hypothetical protein